MTIMRLMHDSVRASAIPTDAEVVGGYVDGAYAWSAADWNRFPDAVKVRISAVGTNVNAHVFDVEVGCIWPPAKVVPLVVAARKLGIDPTVYVNETNDWGPTRAAFDAAGVAHPHWWVANYDGRYVNNVWITGVPADAVGKQFANPPMVGYHADLSYVRDVWPGVDGTFGNPAKGPNQEGNIMANLTEAEQREILAAARKLTDLFNPTDDDRPLPIGAPDDIPGHILSVRGLQEKMRNAQAGDRKVLADMALAVARIDQRGAAGGLSGADLTALATQIADKVDGASTQDLVNALQQVNGQITFRQVPTGG
jgi:hypothetical protein